jgi:multidrug efflux pump subunit AcrB
MEKHLPAGYSFLVAAAHKAQNSGFADLAVALSVSILAVYLALMLRFTISSNR